MIVNQIIRSNRKTIAIIICRDGQVIVRAPMQASKKQIMQFVEQKQQWIHEKRTYAQQKQNAVQPRQFLSGESFLFLGSVYPLEVVSRQKPALAFQDGHFLLAQSAKSQAKEIFTAWYRAQARAVLSERAGNLAVKHNLSFQRIKITSARTRWGSCSSKGTLSFPWRLVMAPPQVIDYVIIHELAHLLERNHSIRFWKQVEVMCPEYKTHTTWLKTNGFLLSLE